jgi:hypothetical protein
MLKQWHLRRKKGFALIMALYLTVIFLLLSIVFLADQMNKSKTVVDYQDSALALQAANAGLNYVVNYLGDMVNDWTDAILLRDPFNGNAICQGSSYSFPYAGNNLSIVQNNLWFAFQPNDGLYETDYKFAIENPIPLTNNGEKVGIVQGTLKLFTSRFENCPPPQASLDGIVQDLKFVSIDVTAKVENPSQNYTYASREILWTGGGRHPILQQFYQCWTCFDAIGLKYPNPTDGTDSASYVGQGYTAQTTIGNLGYQASTNTSTNSWSSPYGADQNGIFQNGNPSLPNAGSAQIQGAILTTNGNTQGVKGCNNCDVVTVNTSANNPSVPLPTGYPFGPALGQQPNQQQAAPSALLQDLQQAATSSCNNGVKTIFVDSSQDVGVGVPGGQPYAIEYSNNSQSQKPGYAIVDITLKPTINNNGQPDTQVVIKQLGYYSGGILSSTTFNMSQFNNGEGGVIFVQGGNVRVHGDLANSGLTIVANEGFTYYNQNGQPINLSNYLSSLQGFNSNCIATYGNIQPTTLINSAGRFNSNVGGPLSKGMDYWIPGSCPNNNCTGTTWSRESTNNTPCSNCLVDGIYYTNYTGDPTSSSNVVAGYHADDVNGQPMTLNSMSCTGVNTGCSYSTNDPNASQTIFAPPPSYNSDGSLQNGVTQPLYFQCSGGTCSQVSSYSPGDTVIWPYPGASAISAIQKSQADDHLIYTKQVEYTDGNLTISGDTGYNMPFSSPNGVTMTGDATGLGLIAQNYIVLNDFVAGTSAGTIPNAKNVTGDSNLNVNAEILSVNHSVQWEGNTVSDSVNPADSYMNGDYTAMNGKYANGQPYQYSYWYNGKTYTVLAYSWEGAPENNQNVSPLLSQNNNWSFNLQGSVLAPYQDVVNTVDSSGNLTGYQNEKISYDSKNFPPGFPLWNFQTWQQFNLVAVYSTLSYTDLGALQIAQTP